MAEPNMTDASQPADGTQRASDPVSRIAALTQRPPSTSIFGRRSAQPDEPAPETPSAPSSAAAPGVAPVPSTAPVSPDILGAAPAPPSVETPSPASGGPKLGRLLRVSADQVWGTTTVMTHWLVAEHELVGDIVGTAFRDVTATAPGRVRGVSASDGSPVSVVCEVGPSSDEALAALLATAALQDGGTVVWLAGEPDATHGATLSWLNRSTSPRFFFIKAAGVRIGDSAAAATLDLVVRPARGTAHEAPAPDPTRGHDAPESPAGRRSEDHEGA